MYSNLEGLKSLEVFLGVKEETLKNLLKQGEIRKYRAGETVFLDKEEVTDIYIVMDGNVSLYKINENGQKKVIFLLDKGKMVNEVIIKELPASVNCQAFDSVELFSINKDKFMNIMKEDFELCKNVIISLSMKTRRMYRQLKNTPPSIKIEKKLAAKIYKLGKDYGVKTEEGILINLNMTVTYIAELLGSQRETVSRALKILQDKKLIAYKNKKILIYDLQEISEFFKTS